MTNGARRPVAALLAAAALTQAACGGGDHGPQPFDAKQVASAFQRLTGDRLVSDPAASGNGIVVLSLDSSTNDATIQQHRYGTFTIYVVGAGDAAPLYRRDLDGNDIAPTRDGIYWRRTGSSWQAAKQYRNVVLQWQAGDAQALDPRWRRLDATLTSLVRGGIHLSPEDTPCAQRHIDPAGGRGTGTCKLGAQTVVVANRPRPLVLGTLAIRRVRIALRRAVTDPALGQRDRARGRFVILSFTLHNRGTRPLARLAPTLAIGDRRYEPDPSASFLVQPRSPLPLQPGQTARLVVPFDLPLAAARDVGRGALLVAGDPDETAANVDGAAVVGWLRLSIRQ